MLFIYLIILLQVWASTSADDSDVTEFDLLKCPVENLPKQGPPQIPPPGLPLQRQWYLYNQIREYVKDSLQDVVCPLPTESVKAACETDKVEYDNPSAGRGRGQCRGRALLK